MPTVVRRSVIAALIVIAAAALFGVTRLPGGSSEPSAAIVRSIFPEPNGQVPQQGQIKIDLEAGWTGKLQVDQKDIPDSQLNRTQDPKVASHVQLIYQPAPGKVLEYFVGGQNCAVLTYWQLATGPSQSFKRPWCFTAV